MNALPSTLFVSSSCLFLAFGAPALAQCEIVRIVGSDNASFDRFGHAVAVSADTAIVGAVNHDHGGTDGGGAYVFELSGATWTEAAELVANDSDDGDVFGAAVALSSERAIVTAPFDDAGAMFSGSAYVFVRNGGTWTQEAKLTPSDPSDYLGFGTSVSLSGDYAIVGAYMFSDFGGVFGAAYVFERTAQGWGQVAKLTPSDAAPDDQFGGTVAISGDYAIVGAAGNEPNQYLGAAYVFERLANGWAEVDKLTASDATPWTYFGTQVAISGGTAAVSSPARDGPALQSGAVYVFERFGAGWQETDILVASDSAIGDSLGNALSISGDRLLAASQWHDEVGNNSGAAYLFERIGAGWIETGKLVPDDAEATDYFGNAVSIFGSTALVGAASKDPDGGAGFSSGYAYLFEVEVGTSYCIAATNSTGFGAMMETQGCGSVSANDLVLLAAPVPDQPGLFYYGPDPAQVPFGNGFRCVGGTLHRLDVTVAVANVLSHDLDVTNPPAATGLITAGSTWNFQAWFRDPAAGGPAFNLSDATSIVFSP